MKEKMRLEEEFQKNVKSHEDEVNLRLKFEEKLNNLHALNRLTNHNLQSTQVQLQSVNEHYEDIMDIHKKLQKELD